LEDTEINNIGEKIALPGDNKSMRNVHDWRMGILDPTWWEIESIEAAKLYSLLKKK